LKGSDMKKNVWSARIILDETKSAVCISHFENTGDHLLSLLQPGSRPGARYPSSECLRAMSRRLAPLRMPCTRGRRGAAVRNLWEIAF
jgi:hypothetical protein